MGFAMHAMGVKVFKGTGNNKYEGASAGLPFDKDFLSRALVSADFDNDGRPDIAAVSEARFSRDFPAPSGVRVCFWKDKGWKCEPVGKGEEVQGLFADQLIAGDVNGDGNKDIVVASLEHLRSLIVWIGDGKGTFTPFNQGLPQERHYLSVSLGDINSDGKDDLVVAMAAIGIKSFKGLKAFLSGPDTFQEISDGLPANELFTAVAAGDLTGDGSVEIVGGTEGLKVFSLKEGRWQEMSVSGLPENGLKKIKRIYMVDVNKDGRMDIALNYSDGATDMGGIRVFLNVPPK
jgi:hypothetical protein